MSVVPATFVRRIREHNRHCWYGALLSWAGAFVAWLVFSAIYVGLALLVETVRHRDPSGYGSVLMAAPGWLIPVGGGLALLLLVWASVDRWRRRYQTVSDRPIIGWHLFTEFLLIPARMTYAIWDHLGLRIRLSYREIADAWQLLQLFSEKNRIASSTLGQYFPDSAQLAKLLLTLQLTRWIDLQRGEGDWFYYVPSDELPKLQEVMLELPET